MLTIETPLLPVISGMKEDLVEGGGRLGGLACSPAERTTTHYMITVLCPIHTLCSSGRGLPEV